MAEIKKSETLWNKLKKLDLRNNPKIAQSERKGNNEVLLFIYFEIKEFVVILIMNLEIYL